LGRKGSLTQLLKRLGTLAEEERREVGKKANEVKEGLEQRIEAVSRSQGKREKGRSTERENRCDSPGKKRPSGKRHPLTQTLDEIVDIFSRLGFEVVEGPEIELDYYNFEALNIPKGHPAREMQANLFHHGRPGSPNPHLPRSGEDDGETETSCPRHLPGSGLPL